MSIHPNTFLNFKYFIMTKHLKLAGMLFLSFFLCVGNYAQAERRTASTSTEQQTGTCTGVVKDAKGETLPRCFRSSEKCDRFIRHANRYDHRYGR